MQRRAKLGDIEFSVVEDEKPRDLVTITDNSVENGQDVSDHVKQESSIIDLKGQMIGYDASKKLQQLKKYQREGKLLNYIGRNIYNNMGILTIDRDHGKQISNGFEFNITLKQVRIATAKTVEIKVVNPVTKVASPKVNTKVKRKTNNGKQQSKTKPMIEKPYADPRDRLTGYQTAMKHINNPKKNMSLISKKYTDPIGFYQGGLK